MKVNTNKILIRLFLLLITFGLYGIIWMMEITDNVNQLETPYKFKSKGNVLFLELITLGIYIFFWSWKIGETLDSIHQSAGNKQKGLKTKYLLCMFLCAPVGFYLMEREIIEIKGEEHQEQIKKSIGISTIVICGLALFLFIPSAWIVRQAFIVGSNTIGALFIEKMALTFNTVFSMPIYQVSYITLSIGMLGILPLYFTKTKLTKVGKIIRNIAVFFTAVTALFLLIFGFGYNSFYFEFSLFKMTNTLNLAMELCIIAVSLSSALLCAWESLQYGNSEKVKSVVWLVGYFVFGIAFIFNVIMIVIFSGSYDLRIGSRQIASLIIPYIAFYAIKLGLRSR